MLFDFILVAQATRKFARATEHVTAVGVSVTSFGRVMNTRAPTVNVIATRVKRIKGKFAEVRIFFARGCFEFVIHDVTFNVSHIKS